MVIQRNWKTASNNTITTSTTTTATINNNDTTAPILLSSEDSNGSWQSTSTYSSTSQNKNRSAISNANNNNANKCLLSNPQMAASVHKSLKQRYNGSSYAYQSTFDAASASMELMRTNIQDEFNKEIDRIVKKYLEMFFQPALKNVKENLGESSITGDCLQGITVSLLDYARAQYCYQQPDINSTIKSKNNLLNEQTNISVLSTERLFAAKTVDPVKRKNEESPAEQAPAIKKIYAQHPKMKTMGRTKQVFWNVSNLTTETLFILDFKANRAFGFTDNTKDRLASKHPELIRYLPDIADKEYLIQQKILSPIHKNVRFLFLVYDEVYKIAQSEEYQNKSIAKLSEEAFKVPEFILQKMKIFFTELSLRSQSFLMNSQNVQQTSQVGSSGVTAKIMEKNSNLTTESKIIGQKTSLSSSHATLTALLSHNSFDESRHNFIVGSLTGNSNK